MNFVDPEISIYLGLGWVKTLPGPSAAATCLTFKTPPADSLYEGIPQILFFWIYKIQSPCFLFWNFTEHCAQQRKATAHYLSLALPGVLPTEVNLLNLQ